MKWRNLREARCPKCNENLIEDNMRGIINCSKCDFYIGESKLKDLLADMNGTYKYRYRASQNNNQRDLNNL